MVRKEDKSIVLKKIEKYIMTLRENGLDIWRLYLFGSYVKGKFSKESDIDLAVFFNKNDIDGFSEDVQLMHLRRKVDLRIEPHSFAKADFYTPDPFVKEIVKSGIRII